MEQEKRWFVSHFAELSLRIKAEEWLRDKQGAVVGREEAKYILFSKKARPSRFRRDPHDENNGPYWGVYSTENPEEIKFLRAHTYYKATTQNNEPQPAPRLLELDFDPSFLDKDEQMMVKRREVESEALPVAPEEPVLKPTRARVGLKK